MKITVFAPLAYRSAIVAANPQSDARHIEPGNEHTCDDQGLTPLERSRLLGFGAWGLGIGVWGLEFGVWCWGLGFGVKG